MRRILIMAALLASTAVHAQTYTDIWNDVGGRSNSELDYAVNADSAACEQAAGPQWGRPSAKFKKCMRAHGWTFSYLVKNQVPSSNSVDEEEASRISQQNADEIRDRIDDQVRHDDETNAAITAAAGN
jgi:hypothetical protein